MLKKLRFRSKMSKLRQYGTLLSEDAHKSLIGYNCGPGGARKFWSDGVNSTAYSRAVVESLEGLEVIENG